MKKILFVLLMVLLTSPLYVKACSPEFELTGFYVELDDCNFGRMIDNAVYFDILFLKEEANEFEVLDDPGNVGYWYKIDHVYEENQDLLSLDNDWISYSAYYIEADERIESSECLTVFEVYGETQFSSFVVLAFSPSGELLSKTSPISTDIMLEWYEDDYKVVTFNSEGNYFYLSNASYDWSNAGSCYGSMFEDIILALISIAAFVGVVVTFAEPAIYKTSGRPRLAAQALLINISGFVVVWILLKSNVPQFAYLGLITILGSQIFKVREVSRELPGKLIWTLFFTIVILVTMLLLPFSYYS